MLTKAEWRNLIAEAEYDFSWGGKYNRPDNMVRLGIVTFLRNYQTIDGILYCAFCGEAMTEYELCHIVSAGGNKQPRRGYCNANLALGCKPCNAIDRERGPIVDYDTIVRPDLIPDSRPAYAELRALGMAEIARREREGTETLQATARKRALRGMAG